MLSVLALTCLSATSKAPISKVLTLRGGIDLGPITSANVEGVLKVAGAVTAAGAITEKYAGIDETTLTKLFKGDVWSTNLIIAMVTGVATNVLYAVGASDFDAGKLASVLWLASVVSKLVDSSFDFSAWGSDNGKGLVEPVIALLVTLLAWF